VQRNPLSRRQRPQTAARSLDRTFLLETRTIAVFFVSAILLAVTLGIAIIAFGAIGAE
jgi:hypothetical protein